MHPLSKSIQRELDDFYQRLNNTDFSIRTITKGALSQARSKLNPESFTILDKVTIDNFYKGAAYYTWDKYRILAVDGSTVALPSHPSVEQEFGVHKFGPYAQSPRSVGRVSLLYDALNGLTLDSKIGPYRSSEKGLCEQHLEHMQPGDLVIFDRLYAGYDLMTKLLEKRVDFLIRLKADWWKVVRSFAQSDVDDQIVDLQTKQGMLKVRLIKISHQGEQQFFCTSVFDKKFTAEDFGELYQGRWGIEEAYKTLKNWIELENFSGKTALAVKQDFFSKILLMNLCAAFAHPVAEKIKREKEGYQINRTQPLAMVAVFPIPLFIHGRGRSFLQAFDDIVSKTIDIIRPHRTFIRKKSMSRTRFFMNYKHI